MRSDQAPVQLVQLTDRCSRHVEIATVVDYVIRDCQPFVTTRLRGQHALSLFQCAAITLHQPAYLGFLFAINNQYPVHELPEWRVRKQGYDDQLVGAVGSIGLAPGFETDPRVQDGLEIAACIIVGEHKLAHRGPIEVARYVDHAITETRPNLIERRLAALDNFASNDVGVDDGDAEVCKHLGDYGLAAGDATGQPDAKWGVGASVAQPCRNRSM
jgi:hypothetical protein